MDGLTLEENIVSKVRIDVDNVMTLVKTRVQDAVLTAIENLVIRRVELAMKSASPHPERSVDGNVLEPDQRCFFGNVKGLRMTACSRINSHTDLNRIDETRGNISVEEGDLLVNQKNIDRQTHAHHSLISNICSKRLSGKSFYFLACYAPTDSMHLGKFLHGYGTKWKIFCRKLKKSIKQIIIPSM